MKSEGILELHIPEDFAPRRLRELNADLMKLDTAIEQCDQEAVRFRHDHTAYYNGRVFFRVETLETTGEANFAQIPQLEQRWRDLQNRRATLTTAKSNLLQERAGLLP